MALLTKAPRGTQDLLPRDTSNWQYVERTALDTAALFGFGELRLPTFEHTELFIRSVGDTTDVVQKEMYTFEKGDRSLTLRPEFTAGVVRAVLENGLLGDALPLRVCYTGSCFRYEKPQSGRLREFHQFGVEMFGAASPLAAAEVISLAAEVLDALGIPDISLEINSIGCPTCRGEYQKKLVEFFSAREAELCETCRDRLHKNPMRILDCKSPVCQEIAKGAPRMLDHLCGECSDHFEALKTALDGLGIAYTVNPSIVRGLDYYTKTVFEFVSNSIGAQGTVCGGGRYDGLVQQAGGAPTPGLGFAMGIERLLMVMQGANCEFPPKVTCDLYLGNMGAQNAPRAFELAARLRREGFIVESDVMNRSLKAQMKYADKIGAKYSMILGDDEVQSGRATLKNMSTGEKQELELGEGFVDAFYNIVLEKAYVEMNGAVDQLTETRILEGK
jgi:histidyl-tRNA synthetase